MKLILSIVLPALLMAANVCRADSYDDATKHLMELETLLTQSEKGSKVDLDKIDELVHKSRRMCADQPGDEGGLHCWNELTRKLAEKYPQTIQELIRKGIEDADRFIFGLGDVGGENNVEFLTKYLDEHLERLRNLKEHGAKEDPEWRFSRAAVLALGCSKNNKAWPALRRALSCEFNHVSCNAIYELANAGDQSIIPTINEWLHSNDDTKRELALRAIVSLSSDQLRPRLSEDLREPLTLMLSKVGRRRGEIIKALACIGDETVLPMVHEMAQDESEYVRETEEIKNFPDPWRGRDRAMNYQQNEALDAIAKLSSLKSLVVLDRLTLQARDEHIRLKAKKIAETIRKRSDSKPQ